MKNFKFLLLSLSFAASTAFADPGMMDFDGDSYSDITSVVIDSRLGNTLSWRSLGSSTNVLSDLGSIGKKGDVPIPAQWIPGGQVEIGVVSNDEENERLIWKIRKEDGTLSQKVFGNNGSLFIAGGDFNGNGSGDFVEVKIRGKRVVWRLNHDPFVSDTPPVAFNFGTPGDRAFFLSPDGSIDWFGVVRAGPKRGSRVVIKNPQSGETRILDGFPKSLSSGSRPRPFPVKSPSGGDVIAVAIIKDGKRIVNTYDLTGLEIDSLEFPGTESVLVGDFLSDAGEEIAINIGGSFTVYNPFSHNSKTVLGIGGTFIDQVTVSTFGTRSGSGGSSGGGSNGGGNNGGGDDSFGDVKACSSVSGWPGSHIYKKIGSKHFGDVRRNTIGVVVRPGGRGPFPGCIYVRDSKGNVVAKLGLYGKGDGWAARYYAGIGCGSDTPFNGSRVASNAANNTGSSSVVFDFGSVCYGPIDPNRCIGSSSC